MAFRPPLEQHLGKVVPWDGSGWQSSREFAIAHEP